MYPFHFSLRSWARDSGLGPKAAAGRARAGPLAADLGPGPGSCAQEYEEKWKGYVRIRQNQILMYSNVIYPNMFIHGCLRICC